ncbi:zf-HC2 domain-containing protein [Streptacidiphilus rugosus]|uniref:zf-HC2 domain-containing protein n=1 Tax=Streptacidiphilus rugosus TaxID=405783 RepID=UPI00068DF3AE|nr:zf-HC2 domain-containing protein [Streptacidiphilus rugosus]
MNEQPRRSQRPEAAELRVTPVSVAVPAPVAQEHHLGDRLAAFVDGELGHVARERVQAHLATCSGCLAEAEAERRVKSRLREVLPPEPSMVFMGRLLAIAEHDEDDSESDPPAPGPIGAGRGVRSLFGGSGSAFGTSGGLGNGGLRGSSFGSGALGADHPVPGVDPRARRERYRGRERGETAAERPIAARLRSGAGVGLLSVQPAAPAPVSSPAPRGRRLVFAAAGAFSVAAVTLSSALTGVTATSEAPSGVSPLSGTGNYAPAGGQLALDNTGADTREGPANRPVALSHPTSGPTVLPADQFR